VYKNWQNPQHMVCHAVAIREKLNCPSNVSRAVGFQLPQDLPPVSMCPASNVKNTFSIDNKDLSYT